MDNRIIFFFEDKLKEFDTVMKKIKTLAPFGVEIIRFDELSSVKYTDILKETQEANIYFGISPVFHNDIRDRLGNYLKTIFELPFSNFIYIYPEPRYLQEPAFILGKSACFYFSADIDPRYQAHSFISFQIQLFEKSITSVRLTDYISDSFKEVVYSEILVKKNREIERLNKELDEMNKIDYLTSLYNRKALYDFLDRERKRSLRDLWRLGGGKDNRANSDNKQDQQNTVFPNKPQGRLLDHLGTYSIMMIDIDDFKKVNDQFGHLVGDEVLKTLGKTILYDNILRENDVAGRFGGEEFIIILPETNSSNAFQPAMRLYEKFRSIPFANINGKSYFITLSIGISEYYPDDKSIDDIILRADKALYYAKNHGKNKVVLYEHAFPQKLIHGE